MTEECDLYLAAAAKFADVHTGLRLAAWPDCPVQDQREALSRRLNPIPGQSGAAWDVAVVAEQPPPRYLLDARCTGMWLTWSSMPGDIWYDTNALIPRTWVCDTPNHLKPSKI